MFSKRLQGQITGVGSYFGKHKRIFYSWIFFLSSFILFTFFYSIIWVQNVLITMIVFSYSSFCAVFKHKTRQKRGTEFRRILADFYYLPDSLRQFLHYVQLPCHVFVGRPPRSAQQRVSTERLLRVWINVIG